MDDGEVQRQEASPGQCDALLAVPRRLRGEERGCCRRTGPTARPARHRRGGRLTAPGPSRVRRIRASYPVAFGSVAEVEGVGDAVDQVGSECWSDRSIWRGCSGSVDRGGSSVAVVIVRTMPYFLCTLVHGPAWDDTRGIRDQ